MLRHRELLTACLLFLLVGIACSVSAKESQQTGIYTIPVETIEGDTISLGEYEGKTLLIVNVASKCGFTPQYEGLQTLYERYGEQGFAVLGFPANNFANQEPGTDEEIQQFCTTNYGVSFPMFSKISVKGDDQHALYQYLTDKRTNPEFAGEITWNFNKFLIGPDGQILNRFGSKVKPESEEITGAIEATLESD